MKPDPGGFLAGFKLIVDAVRPVAEKAFDSDEVWARKSDEALSKDPYQDRYKPNGYGPRVNMTGGKLVPWEESELYKACQERERKFQEWLATLNEGWRP